MASRVCNFLVRAPFSRCILRDRHPGELRRTMKPLKQNWSQVMRNSGPIFTLLLSLSAVNAFGQHIALSFDSLPTAQGWTYFQGGVPESSVFSVTGVSLI